jgi:fusion and transport protein UGO1
VVIRHGRPFRKCSFCEESVQYVRNVDGQRSLNSSSDIIGTSAPPQEEWLFLPPTPGQPSTNPNTTPSSTYNSPPSGSTSSSASSPIVGLELDADDEPFTVYGVLAMFASEYLTTALGMPFEVGKTLLQVEYKPKPGVDDGVEVEGVDYEAETDDADSVAGDQAEGSRRRRDSIEDSVR